MDVAFEEVQGNVIAPAPPAPVAGPAPAAPPPAAAARVLREGLAREHTRRARLQAD